MTYSTTKTTTLSDGPAVERVISWTAGSTRRRVEKFTTIPTAPDPEEPDGRRRGQPATDPRGVLLTRPSAVRIRDRTASAPSRTPERISTAASVGDLCPWWGRNRERAVTHNSENAREDQGRPDDQGPGPGQPGRSAREHQELEGEKGGTDRRAEGQGQHGDQQIAHRANLTRPPARARIVPLPVPPRGRHR